MEARRQSSWAWVTALTVAALAVVAVLAVQASHAAPPRATADKPHHSGSPGAHHSAPPRKPAQARIPDGSGQGRRIVYSLAQRRVWLVDASDGLQRSFTVRPGTVSPTQGKYLVSFRRAGATGSDGVKIENVVYFAIKSGVSIAFSNAADGSSPKPASGARTGGIRVSADDGDAIWKFASVGTPVTVVD